MYCGRFVRLLFHLVSSHPVLETRPLATNSI